MRRIIMLSLFILLFISCKETEYPMIKMTDVYEIEMTDKSRNYTDLFQHNETIYCMSENNLFELNNNGEIVSEKIIDDNIRYYLFDSNDTDSIKATKKRYCSSIGLIRV